MNRQDIADLARCQRQDAAEEVRQYVAVVPINYDARAILAANVARLMTEHSDRSSPAKLARHCFWPGGKKKGERVSERQIRYLLDTRAETVPPVPSPTLDLVVAIGNAFNIPAWQLLVSDTTIREWAAERLFGADPGADARRLVPTLHEAAVLPTPAPPRAKPAARRKAVRDRR